MPKAASDGTITSLFQFSNDARVKAKQNALTLSPQLSAAAQRHANDLANGAKFSHTGSDGSQMGDRIKATGYVFRTAGENIYMQAPRNGPADAVKGWLNSPGHRANLLSNKFTEIGLGYASNGNKHYYVQVFGTPLH